MTTADEPRRRDGVDPQLLADVRDTLTNRMATHRLDLERLVTIPSVSAPSGDPAQLWRSAEAVRDLLAARGLEHVRLLADGGAPAVYGSWLHAGDQAPTVLLYAHHDVQPTGDPEAWTTPPFAPVERDGRLYGRGAADDKAGIVVHTAAVDAWLAARGSLPVNVKVVIEGEEEIGSPHLQAFLDAHAELLDADVLVLTDSMNWAVGVPAITSSLRGLVDATVTVRALDHALHSGMYGGAVPDALTGLVRLLAGLVDHRGRVAIPGFTDDVPRLSDAQLAQLEDLGMDAEVLRADAGVLDGVELIGDPDACLPERLWHAPSATVIGIDAPTVEASSNTLAPSARARVSLRLAPGQDHHRALRVLTDWLAAAAPWGLVTEVMPGAAGAPYLGDREGPAAQAAARAFADAWDEAVRFIGVGGTIPFVQPFTTAFGGAPALLTGVEDPDTRAHGIDESLHLGDWERACLGEALLLAELGRLSPADLRRRNPGPTAAPSPRENGRDDLVPPQRGESSASSADPSGEGDGQRAGPS